MAPSISGHELEKEAALLFCAGAPSFSTADGLRRRGDLHILLVGDPSVAKSELMKFAAGVCPRGIFTSGKASSAAGLTAAIVKQKNGIMLLEGGVMVLGDQGHAFIDEFDKMSEEDRNALHEALEQQTVSIAKAGFVATLNARTAVFAAANPSGGVYDPFKNVLDQINLPVPLITRFDLVFIVKDIPDLVADRKIADRVLANKRRTQQAVVFLEQKLLRKLVVYARTLDPELTEEAADLLEEKWIELRRAPVEQGQIRITPRFLEAMIRLSIARARLLLHERVTEDDARRAVFLVQKMLETAGVDQRTGKTDVGVFYGKPVRERGLRDTALEVSKTLGGETKQPFEDKAFYEEMKKKGFSSEEAEKGWQMLYRGGVVYEVRPGFFRKL